MPNRSNGRGSSERGAYQNVELTGEPIPGPDAVEAAGGEPAAPATVRRDDPIRRGPVSDRGDSRGSRSGSAVDVAALPIRTPEHGSRGDRGRDRHPPAKRPAVGGGRRSVRGPLVVRGLRAHRGPRVRAFHATRRPRRRAPVRRIGPLSASVRSSCRPDVRYRVRTLPRTRSRTPGEPGSSRRAVPPPTPRPIG